MCAEAGKENMRRHGLHAARGGTRPRLKISISADEPIDEWAVPIIARGMTGPRAQAGSPVSPGETNLERPGHRGPLLGRVEADEDQG